MSFVIMTKYNTGKESRAKFVKEYNSVLRRRFRKARGFRGDRMLFSRKHDKEILVLSEWRSKEDFVTAMNATLQNEMENSGITKKLVYHESFDR